MESTNKQCNIIEVINNNPNQYKYTGQVYEYSTRCSFGKCKFPKKHILCNQFESKYDEEMNNIYYLCYECVKGVTIHMNPNIIPTKYRPWSFGPNNQEEQQKLNQNRLEQQYTICQEENTNGKLLRPLWNISQSRECQKNKF